MPLQVIVCAIAKREDLYVDEWVTYYIYGLEVDHVHIFDNSDENTLLALPDRYPGKVSVYHAPGPGMQVPVYNMMKTKVDASPDLWCAFLDIDEFIVLKRHETLAQLLEDYEDCSGLVLNWVLFGDSGHTDYSAAPVTERFTRRERDVNLHVKSIVNLQKISAMGASPHEATYHTGNAVDTSRKVVQGPFNKQGPSDVAVIHHYFGKSRGEFMLKRARGTATSASGAIRSVKEFDDHNFNEVSDFSAFIFYKKARRRLNELRLQQESKGTVVRHCSSTTFKSYRTAMPALIAVTVLLCAVLLFIVCFLAASQNK